MCRSNSVRPSEDLNNNVCGKGSIEASLDDALDKTGNGKFHLLLFVLVGLGYTFCAMEVSVLSFVLPAAKCDFEMSSADAGYLTAFPMFGMALGSFFWGCIADVFGRRFSYAGSLIITGVIGLASSVAQYFYLFVILRAVSGFALAGVLGLSLPYLGEFQPFHRRGRTLSWMELCWTVGLIGVPCLAWAIIPIRMRYETTYFVYDSWNAFVSINSSCILAIGLWALKFPESPKFLAEIGKQDEAMAVLKEIFTMNTGLNPSEYTVHALEGSVIDLKNKPASIEDGKVLVTTVVKNFAEQCKLLFKPPHRFTTMLTCCISFGSNTVYYTLIMWFPELFTRYQFYETLHPGETTSFCTVASVFREYQEPDAICTTKLDNQVFTNTFVLGLACIPSSLLLPLCINKLGSKFFIIFCLMISSAVSIGMNFITTSTQNLIMSCFFEASTSLAVVTLFCSLVDMFPTNIRFMGSGLTIAVGRLGALFGNLSFGYMVDYNCSVPIFLFSAVLFVSGIAAFHLPIKTNQK
ncbi:synaptic vesicle [Nesidiocoris tenuis]|uniref:Synaptic vesicle n=1 Tax=Nesidiocoris tenuis TaxID=355587 RepID=A0ABN7AZU6_9HEMI|nr:synaptic vesicle [Nesidiocoris tenuis]